MNNEIDVEKLINKLLSKITQLEFDNAKIISIS